MSLARRSRRGFSLTEILMAVGILGIGLTMVASIFPVAVDQTRRGTDATMAALCARSMAALLRAKRTELIVGQTGTSGVRGYFANALKTNIADFDRPAEFGTMDLATPPATNPGIKDPDAIATGIPQNMRIYNPNLFLYEAGKRYYTETPTSWVDPQGKPLPIWPMWNAGNYVPVVYLTPIVPAGKRTDVTKTGTACYNNAGGPWRVTIVVFKSRGHVATDTGTIHAQGDLMHPRTRTWTDSRYDKQFGEFYQPAFIAGAGDYIIDRTVHAGEAYLIDWVNTDTTTGGNTSSPPIYLACGKAAGWDASKKYSVPSSDNKWYVLPGAVMAFHTIIGD